MFLELLDVHSYYDKSHILQGVDLQLQQGEMVCLLGRNGVGKTTTLKSIMGMVTPAQGRILLGGKDIVGLLPYQIVRLGVGIVPEDRRIFPSLSVHENLLIGIKAGYDRKASGENFWDPDRAYKMFPRLKELRSHMGNELSGGEQQMLSVVRTLMGNPQLLLVDEPTEGLAPILVKAVIGMLGDIQRSGVTILLVEQNMKAVIGVASRFYIMSKGTIVFKGDRESLEKADEVKRKYLEV